MLNYSKHFKYAFLLFKNITFNVHCLNECKEISIIGWISSISKLKNRSFLKVRDGRSLETIQVVLSNDLFQESFRRGSCIRAVGVLVDSLGKGQSKELQAVQCESLTDKNVVYNKEITDPSEVLSSGFKTGIGIEKLRNELLHLRHRVSSFSAMGRIRASTKQSIRSYMLINEYLEVDPPIITSVDCEGAGESYKIFIEKSMCENSVKSSKLTVSTQLHLEALVLGYGQVYTLGPVFRANKSFTRHHLSEFLMLEVESVNINSVEELCDEIERLVKSLTHDFITNQADNYNEILNSNMVELKRENQLDWLTEICNTKFVRITFDQASSMLKKVENIDMVDNLTNDFSKAEEQVLVSLLGNVPVFVTEFPEKQKPFYCKLINENRRVTMAADLLLPFVGEVAGGSVRETDYGRLKERMEATNINQENLEWYLDLRRIGGCPHSGYGLGFDRLVQFWTGVKSIQDVVLFPRTRDSVPL